MTRRAEFIYARVSGPLPVTDAARALLRQALEGWFARHARPGGSTERELVMLRGTVFETRVRAIGRVLP